MKALFILLFLSTSALADKITVAWTGIASPNTIGYKVHVGTAPGIYTMTLDVGLANMVTLDVQTKYYIVVRSYNTAGIESLNSVPELAIAPAPTPALPPVPTLTHVIPNPIPPTSTVSPTPST